MTKKKHNRYVLIICNTYYQLILAIQMKRTLFANNQVDLWLSDHSVRAEKVAKRLEEKKVFTKVTYIRTKNATYGRSKIEKFKQQISINFRSVKVQNIPLYDEIIYHNINMDFYRLADIYQKIGHRVIWSKLEEGILSYNVYDDFSYKSIYISEFIRKFTRREGVASKVKWYYCTNPEIKKEYWGRRNIRIPYVGSDQEMKEILNHIFDYKPVEFKQKYIFFASSSDIDGNSYGETELVLKIAKRVGKENLLVKMHTRDTRKVYEEKGISVLRNSFVPWEVMQMNMLSGDVVLMTITSGAFLSAEILLNQGNEGNQGIYLYPKVQCNKKTFKKCALTIEDILRRLHEEGKCKNIVTIDSLPESELYNL